MKRAGGTLLVGAGATTLLFACTLVRNLDYLSNGADAGPTSTREAGTSSSSSSSSSGSVDSGPALGEVIAPAQYAPAHLVQDADNLYWTTDDNKVMKLAKAGGAQPVQLAKLDGAVQQITQTAVDVAATGTVYLLLEGAVKAVPKAGGAVTDFVTLVSPMTSIAIAADDTNVFLLASSDPNNDDLAILNRYPKTAASPPTQLSMAGTVGTALLLTTDSVFWGLTNDAGDFVVLQLPKTAAAGVAPMSYSNTVEEQGTAVGIDPSSTSEIVIDGQTFFWADSSEAKVYTQALTPPAGKATALFAADSSDTFDALVEDGTNIYVTSDTGDVSTLVRIPKVGGTPATLNVQPNPTELAVDATYLYVAFNGSDPAHTNGGIARLAK